MQVNSKWHVELYCEYLLLVTFIKDTQSQDCTEIIEVVFYVLLFLLTNDIFSQSEYFNNYISRVESKDILII